jgi:uncharacterized protein YqgC (DUF456 family)
MDVSPATLTTLGQTAAGWVLVWTLVGTGFLGCFLPLLPGTTLILAGVFAYHWLVAPAGAQLSAATLWGISLIMVASHIADVASALVGAKKYGASSRGVWGGLAGLVVGLAFGLPGLLLGPILGVVAGELLSGKQPREAIASAWGTVVGNAAGILFRVVAGGTMVVWFVLAIRR